MASNPESFINKSLTFNLKKSHFVSNALNTPLSQDFQLLLWRNGLDYHIKKNEEWHDDMHMYGSQLPRRLLSKGITQKYTHTFTFSTPRIRTCPAEGRWEIPFYKLVIGRCSGAALVSP
jgi:hypothetical protein